MRKIKLTRQERAIEDSIEELVPVSAEEYSALAHAIAIRRKDAVLNIRVNRHDLESIKQKAKKLGIKYQALISEVLHRVAQVH
jgi:predicted DNA binding CopG/RHH family protein